MLIRNKEDKKEYLVYGFYNVYGNNVYITYKDKYSPLNFISQEECEIIDNTYSKYWIKYDENTFLPEGWNDTNFLYELIDDLEPLTTDKFKYAKEKIDEEFAYYFLNDNAEYQDDNILTVAEPIGENWVLCPECNEAFEVQKKHCIVVCPTCHTRQYNPLYEVKCINHIEGLLKISSSPIKHNTPNKANVNDKDLYNLLNHRNGFYAFESALHVFSDDELNEINTLIESEKLYDDIENYICFAEDIFGNLFCLTGNKVYMLEVETGHLEYIADSLEEWAKEILKDYNFLTGYPLAHDWQNINGKLSYDKRLVPKKLFVLGGQYSVDNLVSQDRFEAMRFRSSIAKQLKNVKDGEKVILTS